MRPVDYLRREHELIMEFIEVLNSVNSRIFTNEVIDQNDLDQITIFIREFVDNIHHLKEENIFFPVLVELDSSNTISILFEEHEQVRGLLVALEEVSKIEKQPLSDLSRHIENYTVLMKEHIFKENQGVFKMADERLSVTENQTIWEKFETFENDIIGSESIEKYYTIVKKLREKY